MTNDPIQTKHELLKTNETIKHKTFLWLWKAMLKLVPQESAVEWNNVTIKIHIVKQKSNNISAFKIDRTQSSFHY